MARSGKLEAQVSLDTTSEAPAFKTKTETGEFRAAADRAQIVILAGTGTGRRYPVKDEAVIGRHPAASVWIPDENVSRRHASISRTGPSEFSIKDLGSRNGTIVNGLSITEQPLNVGDKITIGDSTVLVFTYIDPMEEQLQQQQKMEAVGRLAAGVAHEFNNLLAVMVTNLALLESEPEMEEADRRACFEEARQAMSRSAELTHQMLDFSYKGEPEVAPTDVSDLLRETHRFVQQTFESSLQITLDVEPGLVVLGERTQLSQVLMNICLNAKDAVRQNGQIMLSVHGIDVTKPDLEELSDLEAGEHVLIRVSDNGAGMDAETLRKVFEPFFTTKEPGKGTGLGLSVVLGLVRSHNGAIKIVSEERRGTTVSVYLPRIAGPVQRPLEATIGLEPLGVEGTVLLVDDEQLMLSSLQRTLKAFGLQVVCASNGKEAVQVFEERGEIDLVLLDVIMPVLGGPQTFSLLKRLDPNVKVIVVSGHAGQEVVSQMLEAGALAYLKKPCNINDLRELLLTALAPG